MTPQPWPAKLPVRHVRIARPTDQLDEVVRFYRDGLGLPELGRFTGHAGYRGVMLGLPGLTYHLEFTQHDHGSPGPAPSRDNLLVLGVSPGHIVGQFRCPAGGAHAGGLQAVFDRHRQAVQRSWLCPSYEAAVGVGRLPASPLDIAGGRLLGAAGDRDRALSPHVVRSRDGHRYQLLSNGRGAQNGSGSAS